jgi:Ca2+:H+ antiporter
MVLPAHDPRMHQYVYRKPYAPSHLIWSTALVIPAAYHSAKHITSPNPGGVVATMHDQMISDLDEDGQKGLLIISRGTALLLLGVYVAYLIFQLKTHASLFNPRKRNAAGEETAEEVEEESDETARMSVVSAGLG